MAPTDISMSFGDRRSSDRTGNDDGPILAHVFSIKFERIGSRNFWNGLAKIKLWKNNIESDGKQTIARKKAPKKDKKLW
jgi:hypothetical protein